jgi:hypothetical protein
VASISFIIGFLSDVFASAEPDAVGIARAELVSAAAEAELCAPSEDPQATTSSASVAKARPARGVTYRIGTLMAGLYDRPTNRFHGHVPNVSAAPRERH